MLVSMFTGTRIARRRADRCVRARRSRAPTGNHHCHRRCVEQPIGSRFEINAAANGPFRIVQKITEPTAGGDDLRPGEALKGDTELRDCVELFDLGDLAGTRVD